jgi:Rap1a immunity proteins
VPSLLVAVALSCLVVAGPAATEGFIDGNKLFRDCEGGDDPRKRQEGDPGGLSEWGAGFGFFMGVADALDGSSFCLASGNTGLTAEQVIDLVKLYLRAHPETRHYGAASQVENALKEKFPCKE